ncbi:MAG: hypothetical protein AAB263_14850 [Planctomycetota bacterium]
MIKILVLYANTDHVHFDFNYYANKRIPIVMRLLGDACVAYGIDRGVVAIDGVSKPPSSPRPGSRSVRSQHSRPRFSNMRRPSWLMSLTTRTSSQSCKSTRSLYESWEGRAPARPCE